MLTTLTKKIERATRMARNVNWNSCEMYDLVIEGTIVIINS